MSIAVLLPKIYVKFAHLNICSLRNKVHEVADLLLSNTINIVALSETHLDETFDDNAVSISGYNLYNFINLYKFM